MMDVFEATRSNLKRLNVVIGVGKMEIDEHFAFAFEYQWCVLNIEFPYNLHIFLFIIDLDIFHFTSKQ